MSLVSALLSLLLPALLSYPVAALFLKEEGPVEIFFYAFGLGLGLVTYIMFLNGLLGIPFSAPGPLSVLLVLFLPSIWLLYTRGQRRGKILLAGEGAGGTESGLKLYVTIIILAYLSVKAGFVFYESITRPIFSWDAVSNWSQGAKFFYYERGLLLDPMDENFFGRGYRAFLGHPLHATLVQVWTALWLGSFHEVYVKLWSLFYYTALLGLFYFALKRETGGFHALVSVFFLSTAPLLAYHGTDAYSEVVLAYYGLASTVSFLRYNATGRKGLLLVSGTMLAFGALTKNEGLFFFLAIMLALFILILTDRDRGSVDILYLLIPFLLLYGPYLGFKAYYGFGFGHGDAASGFRWLSDPKFGPGVKREVHWEVLPVIVREFFLSANHNLIFSFWVLLSAFYARTIFRTDLKFLYIIILTLMAAFSFVYLTLEVTAVTETTGIHRNTLTYLPLLFLSASLLLFRARSGQVRGQGF